jgi:hypothetical protein
MITGGLSSHGPGPSCGDTEGVALTNIWPLSHLAAEVAGMEWACWPFLIGGEDCNPQCPSWLRLAFFPSLHPTQVLVPCLFWGHQA